MIAAGKAGVTIETVGRFGGDMVRMGASEAPLEELAAAYRGSFSAAFG